MTRATQTPYTFLGEDLQDAFPLVLECFHIPPVSFIDALQILCPKKELQYFNPFTMEIPPHDESPLVLVSVKNYNQVADLLQQTAINSQDCFIALLLLEHLYIQEVVLRNNVIELEEEYDDAIYDNDALYEIHYENDIRPELLELYLFINDRKWSPPSKPITLKWGHKTLKLQHANNWFTNAINQYLESIDLYSQTHEDRLKELEYHRAKKIKQSGRKVDNRFQTLFIHGIDKLYLKKTNDPKVTNQECEFIRDYLKYMNLPISKDDFDHDDDIKNIRAKVQYMRKNGCPVRWTDDNDAYTI